MVHVSSGVSGLATVMVVGNRVGFGTKDFAAPHNILLTYMGKFVSGGGVGVVPVVGGRLVISEGDGVWSYRCICRCRWVSSGGVGGLYEWVELCCVGVDHFEFLTIC